MNTTELLSFKADRDAARVNEEAPGWRCVWLPRHGDFVAFLDVEMADDGPRPSVRGASAEKVLAAIEAHTKLRRLIREYLDLQRTRTAT